MDLVIPIKDDCRDLTELKYALRSFEKYVTGIRDVYVVTHDSSILDHFRGVGIISSRDLYPNPADKEKNILMKIYAACDDPRVSQDFLFTNDDIFILHAFNAESWPFYFRNTLQEAVAKRSPDDPYTQAMSNTIHELTLREAPTRHFDVHSPIIYNKQRFEGLMQLYPWSYTKRGYLIKSLYSNSHRLDGPHLDDIKFKRPMVSKAAIYRRIQGQPMFSIDEAALNEHMLVVLQELFPQPSRWEF